MHICMCVLVCMCVEGGGGQIWEYVKKKLLFGFGLLSNSFFSPYMLYNSTSIYELLVVIEIASVISHHKLNKQGKKKDNHAFTLPQAMHCKHIEYNVVTCRS